MVGFDLGWSGLGGFGTRFGALAAVGGSTGPYIPTFSWNFSDWDTIALSRTFLAAEAYRSNITTSADLPGSTHWDPAPVPVGDQVGGGGGGGGILSAVVLGEGTFLPDMALPGWLPGVGDESEPSIIYSPPPILLPGQTDPGREEQESEEGEMAHTWTHVGSQLLGALFPNTVTNQAFVAGSGLVGGGGGNGAVGGGSGAIPAPQGDPMYTGSCPPAKTRTLTIDCATGQEVKRKRRRRRALLTQGDMGVLFQIASLPNNANVRVALAGAIRR